MLSISLFDPVIISTSRSLTVNKELAIDLLDNKPSSDNQSVFEEEKNPLSHDPALRKGKSIGVNPDHVPMRLSSCDWDWKGGGLRERSISGISGGIFCDKSDDVLTPSSEY